MGNNNKFLFNDFQPASKDDWIKKANDGLNGENVLEKFKWTVEQDIKALPYYDHTDLPTFKGHDGFHNRPSTNPDTGEIRHWDNLQVITVAKEEKNNQSALIALTQGADGIIFDISNKSTVNFSKLLKDILPEHCNISFKINDQAVEKIQAYFKYLESQNVNLKKLSGLIISNKDISDIDRLPSCEGIRYINLAANQDMTYSDTVSDILLQLNTTIEALSAKEFSVSQIIDKCFITLPISTGYFEEIVRLRVIRQLFYQVARAYGYENFSPEDIHIHCESRAWNNDRYMPHANMLKSSISAMAAILGGCNSLWVEPEDPQSTLMTRVALNTSTILKEEAYLNKTMDVVAGTYYLENLIDLMAQKAWSKFRQAMEIQNTGKE